MSEERQKSLERDNEQLTGMSSQVGMRSNMQSQENNNLLQMKLELEAQVGFQHVFHQPCR